MICVSAIVLQVLDIFNVKKMLNLLMIRGRNSDGLMMIMMMFKKISCGSRDYRQKKKKFQLFVSMSH